MMYAMFFSVTFLGFQGHGEIRNPRISYTENKDSLHRLKSTPWKINMEHNHEGLEDHFPF